MKVVGPAIRWSEVRAWVLRNVERESAFVRTAESVGVGVPEGAASGIVETWEAEGEVVGEVRSALMGAEARSESSWDCKMRRRRAVVVTAGIRRARIGSGGAYCGPRERRRRGRRGRTLWCCCCWLGARRGRIYCDAPDAKGRRAGSVAGIQRKDRKKDKKSGSMSSVL